MSQPIALVTGGSRGAGKGIALGLASKGYIVYITGRTQREGDHPLPGNVWATVEEINQIKPNLGYGIICDHTNPQEVEQVFKQIKQQHNRLDVLVNNATLIHDDLIKPKGFWEKSLDLANILDVGLKSAYVASFYAAPIMVENQRGLIVNTSSFGARCYMHGPSYGAQKAGLDKMSWDMAHDFHAYHVACISLWMGMLLTERTQLVMEAEPDKYAGFQELAETPQFQGLIIDALYNDSNLMQKSGQTLISAELGQEYNIEDIDGKQPISHRAMLGAPIEWHPAVVE